MFNHSLSFKSETGKEESTQGYQLSLVLHSETQNYVLPQIVFVSSPSDNFTPLVPQFLSVLM